MTKNLTNNSKLGFSLIELLMYIGIFSMLIVILFQLLVSILDVQLESKGHSSIDQDGLFILSRLSYDIARSNSIASPSAGQSSQNVKITVNGTDFEYTNATSSMVLTNMSTGEQKQLNSVNSEVSNVTFTRRSDTEGKNFDTITASFTITGKPIVRGVRDSKSFRTTIGVRKP
jgi:hypothetical protein